MQTAALHQTHFEHTSILRVLFHAATATTLPRVVKVLRPVCPILLTGRLILLLLLRPRRRAPFLLDLGHELAAAAREVGLLDEAAEVRGAVAPGVDAEHGLTLDADYAHPLVAALLLRLHLTLPKRNGEREPNRQLLTRTECTRFRGGRVRPGPAPR
jgi:hypothetical protein